MAAHKDRIDRLDRLHRLIARTATAEECPDAGALLERLADLYAHHLSPASRRRAIQRDLEELVDTDRIEVVNPGGKPLRYQCAKGNLDTDPYVTDYACKAIRELVKDALPSRRLELVMRQLLGTDGGLGLDDDRLCIVSDTLRLQPAVIGDKVLGDVLEALALSRALRLSYRDAAGKLTRPIVHGQALLQRGPRVYLFALKDEEAEPVRMYALHRITRSAVCEQSARRARGFALQQAIDRGQADFGDGELIDLELRARGYVADLLRDCPLAQGQRIDDEDEGAAFDIRVRATLPGTGQLLRWLLGCGDKVEVLAPAHLRHVLKAQTAKASALYQ